MLVRPHELHLLRRRIRLSLLVGLGTVVVLLVALGVYAARTLSGLVVSESADIGRYFHRIELLSSARHQLVDATSAVQQYLLDPDVTALQGHRDRATSAWSQAVADLDAYKDAYGPETPALQEALNSQLSTYGARVGVALKLEGDQRYAIEVHALVGELSRMRDGFLATVSEMGSHNRSQLQSEVARAGEVVRRAEHRIWIAIAVTTLLALSVAGATFGHLTGLERIAAARHDESLRAAAELERLSRRLLTVQEEEKRSIARELHDDYGQRIACLLVELSFARSGPDVSPALRASLQTVEDNLRGLAHDLQQMSRGLHSAVLENIGLEDAIRSDCAALLQRSGLRIDFETAGVPRHLPVQISLALYRVFQEALKNALNHSRTDRLKVTLCAEDEDIVLRVQDFGRGFDAESCGGTEGLGLVSMRERIRMVSGRFVIHSMPGNGTQVEAKVSLS